MSRIVWLLFVLIFVPAQGMGACGSPGRYHGNHSSWVYFTDKDGVTFDPFVFFHSKAIERRLRHQQCLYDPADFPVNLSYIDSVRFLVDSVGYSTRWFNAVSVWASPDQLIQVSKLPFVKNIEPSHVMFYPAQALAEDDSDIVELSARRPVNIEDHIDHLEGSLFTERGFDGKDLRIAVFDAGFPGVDRHPAFAHLIRENRIVATWDFHRNREDVYRYMAHGTMVLSLLAGIRDGIPMGLATGASFLLARTEIWREPYAEEQYWLAAMEWADQHGADIINSSLGYIFHRYFPEQMDGQTSLVARAANMAARKGILVVNAAGNEGDKDSWRIIVTPADADSVLTVGAVELPSRLRASFSSTGPTADKRLKPNLVALGYVKAAGRRGYSNKQGTSFSSPLVTGFAACLWQMYPEWTNMQVFEAMEKSGSLYPYFDYDHGYGIPQASHFFQDPASIILPTFDLVRDNNHIKAILRFQVVPDHLPVQFPYLYYHIRNKEGDISQYAVVRVEQYEVLSLHVNSFLPGQRLFVHYAGHTSSWQF
jgi:serine protease AprX